MKSKTATIQKAIQDIKSRKIVLYHIITPIDDVTLAKIQENGYFNASRGALGGQSDGYYFFTTRTGAENHIKNMRDTWEKDANKHAYIVECEIDSKDITYPTWKLDYEAMQDFMFDMIYNSASQQSIKFNGITINTDNKKLIINNNGKFERIDAFNPNAHSGLIEQIVDYLYKHDTQFKKDYDKLLMDVFAGNGKNPELYAVKTTTKQKITKITKIADAAPMPPVQNHSQIDKFMLRYGRRH